MANCDTVQELLALQKGLMDVRDMVGWLCTGHRYSVNYANNPSATQRIQQQLDVAAEFIHVIYIYSILDEAGFKPSNKWISSYDKMEFKAWIHIRHTGAHTPGGRAQMYYQDFDDFMTSNQNSKSGLKPNCAWTATAITLPYAMSFHFFEFVSELLRNAIGHCANGNQPP